jgi:hypothetical protein
MTGTGGNFLTSYSVAQSYELSKPTALVITTKIANPSPSFMWGMKSVPLGVGQGGNC